MTNQQIEYVDRYGVHHFCKDWDDYYDRLNADVD